MLFLQQFTRNEYIFGNRTIYVAVSDSYSELLSSQNFTPINIIGIEDTDSNIDIEKGSASKGELSFNIKQSSCITPDDLNALFFILDVANDDVGRYIAIWIDVRNNDNCEFLGKISSKITGDDKIWLAGLYATQINPIREYKFNAYSIDLEILDKVKLLSKIEIETGKIDSVYDRINLNTIKNMFTHKPLFKFADDNHYFYQRPTGNLYNVIQYLLDITKNIVNEIIGTEIDFYLQPSYLGIQSSQILYINHEKTIADEFPSITNLTQAGAKIKWRLDPNGNDPNGEWASPFISEKMLIPRPWDENNDEKYRTDANAFNNYESIAKLLQGIASSFGCYLVFNYSSATQITITMLPKGDMVESNYIHLTGTKDAGINTDVIVISNSNRFYSFANIYASDGKDTIVLKKGDYEETVKFKEVNKKIADERENKGIDYEKLLLSTSPTMISAYFKGGRYDDWKGRYPYVLPLNCCWRNDYTESNERIDYFDLMEGDWEGQYEAYDYAKFSEILTNQIMLLRPITIGGQVKTGISPAYKIYAQIKNENVEFNTLSEYLNEVYARDRRYYKTEYQLTVPFFSGFATDETGTNPSWKNCKKGAKIKLNEPVRRYDKLTGEFIEEIAVKDFIVVGIKRNYTTLTTTLKLQNIDKYAFGYNDDPTTEQTVDLEEANTKNDANPDYRSQTYEIEEGQTVADGNAVVLNVSTQKIKESTANSAEGSVIGIANQSGIGGEKIQVIEDGKVYKSHYNLSGKHAFVRGLKTTNGCNIRTIPLVGVHGDENMYIRMGQVIDTNTLKIDINEIKYEE